MRRQSWSIIILCYNEEQAIGQTIKDALKTLAHLSSKKYELIVVDDGSTDQSAEVIGAVKKNNQHMRVITHAYNRGIGEALRSGYTTAACENVCVVPGDGQFRVKELLPFKNLKSGEFVSFYRKENLEYSFFRNVLSLVNRKINKWFFGIDIKDVNWVKIYKLAELKKLDLKLNSSLIESEICAKLILRGRRLIEQESMYLPRVGGVDKGDSLKIIWQAAVEMAKLFISVQLYKRELMSGKK